MVIAANTGEATPEDKFKIEKLTVEPHGCYENKAVVTVPGADRLRPEPLLQPATASPASTSKKFTNGNDADTADDAPPRSTPGDTVTWTYKVTNTGNVAFTTSQVVVTDDNGTPGNTADDFSTANGAITFRAYCRRRRHPARARRDVDSTRPPASPTTWSTAGAADARSTSRAARPLDGTDGNIRTFTPAASR